MLFFLFALLISCTVARPDASRIVGGLPAAEGQFKYLAQLNFVSAIIGSGTYTGSIISDQWILTTAMVDLFIVPKELTVVVGSTQIDGPTAWRYDVSEIIRHPNGTILGSLDNNIALIKVKSHMMLEANVASIFLSSTTKIPLNLSLSHAAWGFVNSSSGVISDTLQFITLNTISMTECRKFLSKERVEFDDEMHFCTAPLAGNGPCGFDVGAPLVYGDYQIGLDVLSVSCEGNGLPTVFIKIGYVRDWIMKVTGGLK